MPSRENSYGSRQLDRELDDLHAEVRRLQRGTPVRTAMLPQAQTPPRQPIGIIVMYSDGTGLLTPSGIEFDIGSFTLTEDGINALVALLLTSTTPAANGTAAVGTEKTPAHGDHVHPKDTTPVYNRATKTTDYVATVNDTEIWMNSGSPTQLTLPTAASAGDGKQMVVKMFGTGAVTVKGNGSENIDGANTFVMTVQYQAIELTCDGTQWGVH